MFNIGFAELILVLLIAFLVVGPRDLPRVARFLGRCVKWVRSIIAELKAESGWDDVMRETGDIRKDVDEALKQADIRQELKSAGTELRKTWTSAEKETFRTEKDSLKRSASPRDDSSADSDAGGENEPAAELSGVPQSGPDGEAAAEPAPPAPSECSPAPRSWKKYKEEAHLNHDRIKEDSEDETGND